MASPHTSELTFVSDSGEPLSVPVEWAPGLVVLPVPWRQLSAVRVRRNGQPLDVSVRLVGDQERLVASWPRSPAGTYVLDAQLRDGSWVANASWFVPPSKLTTAAVDAMLDRLERLPASIAI